MASQVGLVDHLGRGHHDDGREGVVLTKIAAGQLVKVPFGAGGAVNSGLAHTIGSGSASSQTQTATNTDGSGTGVNFSVPSGLTQGAAWTEVLYGSVVGVRWRRNTTSTLAPFGVVIDGVAYTMRSAKVHHDASVPSATVDHESLWIVADDLDPNVPHTVRIIATSDAYGATTKAVLMYGWLLEASRGYKDSPRWGYLGTAGTLSTSTTALSSTDPCRKILLHNTDASTRTVTLKRSTTVLKVLSLAAGTSGEIDFGVPMLGVSNLTIQADANSVVNYVQLNAEAR